MKTISDREYKRLKRADMVCRELRYLVAQPYGETGIFFGKRVWGRCMDLLLKWNHGNVAVKSNSERPRQ